MNLPRTRAVGAAALTAALAAACGEDEATAPLPPPPAPGAASVTVGVFGPRPNPDGYVVELSGGEEGPRLRGAVEPEGGTVAFRELAPGAYSVAVTPGPEACPLEDDGRRSVVVEGGYRVARLLFTVSCTDGTVVAAYERTSPGTYSRFYLLEDGTFLLDSGGPGASDGTYSVADSVISFDFGGSRSWGKGRLRGECMTVDYSDWLLLSDFEPGEYCRLPGPAGAGG